VDLRGSHPTEFFSPPTVGLIAHAQGFAGLTHGLALAEQDFGFTEFADDLFGVYFLRGI